jgi:hypothetical protein
MKPVALESGALISAAYDATRELLQLEFRDGAVYQYFDVAAAIYESLLQAPSKGSYFNRAIRGRFACTVYTTGSLS